MGTLFLQPINEKVCGNYLLTDVKTQVAIKRNECIEGEKMTKKKTIIIKLIKKKTGEKVRTLRFRKPSEFDYFLNSFKKMRYPGYDWEYLKK